MADPCAETRALTSEVALGVAPAEERARVLGHVASCSDCRAFLVELSTVVDNVIALTPEAEPPGGFESAVLERLIGDSAAQKGRPRRARWPVLVAAVAALVLAGLTAVAVHRAGRDDRELADAVRRTLDVAGGDYFTAFPLVADDGRQQGTVFGYQGHLAWVVVTLDQPLPPGAYAVELVGLDGKVHRLAGALEPAAAVWSANVPIAIHEASELRVVDEAGHAILTAALLPP